MTVVDRLTVAAAEATMRAVGPRAGLRAFRTIVDRVSAAERARAILAGLDCAIALGDRPGLDDFIARWRVQSGDHFPAVARRCLALRSVSMAHARQLAEVECARRPDDGQPLYLLGRLRGSEGRAELRRALRLADRPPRQPELVAAIRDRLTWLGDATEGFDQGERAAVTRLGKARADLRQGGRYGRVAALDVLTELADGALRDEALALAAAHGSRADLTTIERDRLRTLFAAQLAPAEKAAALGWLETRAALEAGRPPPAGMVPGVSEATRSARTALERGAVTESGPRGAALAVVAAMSEGPAALTEAARAFAAVADAVPAAAEPYMAAAALAARADGDAGRRLTERLLALPAEARRGWLRLGKALRDPPLRAAAFARASAAGEPGATEALALATRETAWKAFRAGQDERAARAIEDARVLLRRR